MKPNHGGALTENPSIRLSTNQRSALKALAYAHSGPHNTVNMSDEVREAIDLYLVVTKALGDLPSAATDDVEYLDVDGLLDDYGLVVTRESSTPRIEEGADA